MTVEGGKLQKKRTGRRNVKRNLQLYALIFPSFIKVLIFSYLPMIGLIMAFQHYIPRRGLASPFVGFQWFEYLFSSNTLTRLLTNAVTMNLLFIVTGTVISLLLGLFLYEITNKYFLKISQTLIFFPYFIAMPLVGTLLYALIGDTGIITNILAKMGVEIDFYQRPDLWKGILTIANVWKTSGVNAVIYYAILMGANRDTYEAASIDGAGRFRQMWVISLPHLKEIVLVGIIMSSANIIKFDFNMVYFLTRDDSTLYPTTDVIETFMYRMMSGGSGGRDAAQYEISIATGLFQGVVGLVLSVLTNFVSKKLAKVSLY